jgi:hypothetical protein
MKYELTGTIDSMVPWAPGSPSTDVEISFHVANAPNAHGMSEVRGRAIFQIPGEDAAKLLYGQTIRVVVSTDGQTAT